MMRPRAALLCVLALAAAFLGAQTLAASSTVSWEYAGSGLPSTGIVRDVAFGDIDHDGRPELAAGFTNGPGLAIYGRDGSGIWSTTGLTDGLPATGSYERLAVGDVIVDGKPDIFAARGPNAGLTVWKGDGAGGWSQVSAGLPPTGTYKGVALGDVDRDGQPDLIAAGTSTGVRVYRNDTTAFTVITGPVTTGSYNEVAAAYVNDDAYVDVAATNGSAGIYFWKGGANSSWTLARTGLPTTPSFRGLAIGDVDNDSRPELVASRAGFSPNAGIVVYDWRETSGDWALAANQISTTLSFSRIALRDANNDGWLDVLAAGYPQESGPGLAVWLGGPFGYTATASPAVTVGLGSLALADLDLDGLMDVTAGDANNGGLAAWRSGGAQSTYDSWLELPSPQAAGSPLGLGRGDLDRDGYLDVVLPGLAGGLEGWLGDGGNSWTACSGLSKAVPDGAFGDILMDVYPQIGQDPTIIAARTDGGGISTVHGVTCSGGGGDGAITASGSYGALSAGDVYHDGTLAVVAARRIIGGGALNLWVSTAAGWGAPVTVASSVAISDTALGDLDHDGLLEIVTADAGNGGISFYDFAGKLWTKHSVAATGGYSAVAVSDLDSDGNLDVAAARSSGAGGIEVWLGDGSGGNWKMEAGPDSASPHKYYALDVADFDHDGKLDILAAGMDYGVRLWANRGGGTWSLRSTGLPAADSFRAAVFGHVDRDGNPDILAATEGKGVRLWSAADAAPPTVSPFRPTLWISATQNPTLTAHVLDAGSGISTTSGQYRYSTNGGATWSGWAAAPITGSDGSTAQQTMTTAAVPFGQDSQHGNLVEFRAADLDGNVGTGQSEIWIDTTPPPPPSFVQSESHTQGSWSTNTFVTVAFAGVNDGMSGWDGTSVLLDLLSNSLPPAVVDTESGQYTVGPLADGLWYAHVRARDAAGNWSTVATNRGPYGIDTTPPSNPTIIHSSDHDTGTWSSDGGISMDWHGAADVASGISGYSYEWSHSATTIPDTITETNATQMSTSRPTGNDHWFHVRARDWAGNWAAQSAHAGPYYIDLVKPASSASSPSVVGATYFVVSWTGSDAHSGVMSYDIQSRDKSAGGGWIDWRLVQAEGSATFNGQDGHIYEFRSRAHDWAGNVEDYPSQPDSTTAVQTIDLFIKSPGIEVNQSSQDLNNSVVLLRSKRTFVRCYAQSSGGSLAGVNARLKFYSNGVYQALLYPSNPGGVIEVKNAPIRANLNDAFLFEVPASYMKVGTATFECEINVPTRKYAETDYTNNTQSVTLNVNLAGVLNLNIVDARYYYGGVLRRIRNQDRQRLEDWLEAAYPIQWVNPTWSYLNPPYETITAPFASDVNADLDGNISDMDEALAMHHYGMAIQVDNNTFMRGSGVVGGLVASGPTGPSTWGAFWDTDGSFGDWYGGHELSHNYGLRHINCAGTEPNPVPYAYPGGHISPNTAPWALDTVYGIDGSVNPPTIVGPEVGDIRSYCEPIWIGPDTYRYIWPITSWASQSAVQSPAGPPVDRLSVSGSVVTPTLQVTLGAFYHLTSATDHPGRDISGAFSIRFFNEAGDLLQNYAFSPTWEEAPGTVGGINERPPWVEGTRQIAIWYGEDALVTRTVSANVPVVTMISPNGGETLDGATAAVEWSASDADGGDLTFHLDYSRDGGATWTGISPSLHGLTATLDLSILPGSSQAKFRVRASDGVNTGYDATDGVFTVPSKAPEITRLEPASGTTFVHGQTVTLRGGAYDVEDNVLGDDGLAWTSSIMGALGTGRLLQPTDLIIGTHTITLTATDSDGNAASAETIIVVGPREDEVFLYLPVVFKGTGAQ